MPRVVVVTGAGGGLGRALIRTIADRGDLAVAFGRDAERLAETGAGLPADRFEAHAVDAADLAAVEAALAALAARHGRIDGLFANAAAYPRQSLLEQSAAAWMEVMRLNVGGVVAACRGALPVMQRTGHGRIIIVGSFADGAPLPRSSAYSASKGALHALTRAIAEDVGGDHPDILVNEWVPGALATQMGIPSGLDPAVSAAWGADLLDLPAGGPTGRIFERNRLVEEPRSLRRRILDKLLFR